MEDRRISKDMFIQDVEGLDKKSKQSKVTKNKKIIINIIIIISLICLIALGLIFYFIFKKYSKEKEENILYNPIPPEEDLDFTEEAHRSFSREVATQTMVLASNNDVLPLRQTDQVVLFGDGTKNTVYGGRGSGEVYNKGKEQSITPVKIIEGIENYQNNFTYVKNDKGYEIGAPNSNLTEQEIQQFAIKRENVERTVAI